MHDRDGELYLGDIPLSIATSAMSDVAAIRADMRAADVGVRVLSAPPFAFPLGGGDSESTTSGAFNDALTEVVAGADGALLGLGMVPSRTRHLPTAQLDALAPKRASPGWRSRRWLAGGSLDAAALRMCSARRR